MFFWLQESTNIAVAFHFGAWVAPSYSGKVALIGDVYTQALGQRLASDKYSDNSPEHQRAFFLRAERRTNYNISFQTLKQWHLIEEWRHDLECCWLQVKISWLFMVSQMQLWNLFSPWWVVHSAHWLAPSLSWLMNPLDFCNLSFQFKEPNPKRKKILVPSLAHYGCKYKARLCISSSSPWNPWLAP